jgi:hypothetical protein
MARTTTSASWILESSGGLAKSLLKAVNCVGLRIQAHKKTKPQKGWIPFCGPGGFLRPVQSLKK